VVSLKSMAWITSPVDYCVITGSSPKLIEAYKKKLNDSEWYSLTYLGPIHWLLGIKAT